MDATSNLQDRRGLEQQVIERAWRDDNFRQELLSNPTAAAREMGINLPAGIKIVVHEETPGTIHFVLPRNPADFEDTELSDAELEMVAGGTSGQQGTCMPPPETGRG